MNPPEKGAGLCPATLMTCNCQRGALGVARFPSPSGVKAFSLKRPAAVPQPGPIMAEKARRPPAARNLEEGGRGGTGWMATAGTGGTRSRRRR
jgi:hypothetical protein